VVVKVVVVMAEIVNLVILNELKMKIELVSICSLSSLRSLMWVRTIGVKHHMS
jgi:hypothetical protein